MTEIASITTPVIPATIPHAEPVRVPRPGRPWTKADLLALANDERHYELVVRSFLAFGMPWRGCFGPDIAVSVCVEACAYASRERHVQGFLLHHEEHEVHREISSFLNHLNNMPHRTHLGYAQPDVVAYFSSIGPINSASGPVSR